VRRIVKKLLPVFIKDTLRGVIKRLNAERWGIEQFLKESATSVKSTDRVLDAGAGGCDYKVHFSHSNYESTDITVGFSRPGESHTYISELHNIPIRDNTYDVIVNTQVLEHVEYPQRVINEFIRVLKPNGRLFLTTPQSWGIHMAPYHFYNFTRYGLESLFKNAGFEIRSISPIGGIFWNLAKIIAKMPRYIIAEHLRNKNLKTLIFLYPVYLICRPLCEYVIPFVFFYLDRIDLNRGWTIGYVCHCEKRANV
jgi:SAM-dependent methyltransferase